MDEQELRTSLGEQADDIVVGRAPLAAMGHRAARHRARVAAGAAASAVLAVVVVGVVVRTTGEDADRSPVVTPAETTDPPTVPSSPPPSPTGPPEPLNLSPFPGPPSTPPTSDADLRLVGLGGLGVRVPTDWRIDDVECNGLPKRGTVIIEVRYAQCLAGIPYPADTTAVRLRYLKNVDTAGWQSEEIAGVSALRSPATSHRDDFSDQPVFDQSLAFPGVGIVVSASSSISPEAVTEALSRAAPLDGEVGVPGYQDLGGFSREGRQVYPDGVKFRTRLLDLGLRVRIVEGRVRTRGQPGAITAVEPEPGTVVPADSTVRVVVSP